MRSVQVSKPKGPLEIVEKDTPEPGARQVRIKVQACGVCHSDSFTKEGLFPGIQYPRVPGHEIAGIIDEVGKRSDALGNLNLRSDSFLFVLFLVNSIICL